MALEFFDCFQSLLIAGLAFQTGLQFFEGLTIPFGIRIKQTQHDMGAAGSGVERLGLPEGASRLPRTCPSRQDTSPTPQ